MSSDNEDGVQSSFSLLGELLESIRDNAVTAGKDKGYFVSEKKLRKAANLVAKINAIELSEDQSLLLNSQSEKIAEWQSYGQAMKVALAKKEAELVELRKSHTLIRDDLIAIRKDLGPNGQDAKKQIDELKHKLDASQKELGKAKVIAKAASKSFDPDEAAAAKHEKERLHAQVQIDQAEYDNLKQMYAAAKALEAENEAKAKAKEAEIAALQNEVSTLKSKHAFAQKDQVAPIQPVKIQAPLVRAIFGDKGLRWLENIDLDRRIKLRDYAYSLLQTANSARQTRGLADLIKIVINWLSQRTFAAREVIRPWLDMIYVDLSTASVKALSFYREKLQEIIADYKAYKNNPSTKFAQAQFVVKNVAAGFHAFKKQLPRKGFFSRLFSKVKSGFYRFLSLFSRKSHVQLEETKEEDVIFDNSEPLDVDSAAPDPPEGDISKNALVNKRLLGVA